MTFTLRTIPPSTTAQMKRRSRAGHYYQPEKMQHLEQTWAALLRRHVPAAPMTGPVDLSIRLVYPHLKAATLNDRGCLIPKVTRPDADNCCKALIDLLAKMRFLTNDSQVARLTVEKWHGPERHVGITLAFRSMLPEYAGGK
jgi:Holliday junction resolvase RusA-like endonuclease